MLKLFILRLERELKTNVLPSYKSVLRAGRARIDPMDTKTLFAINLPPECGLDSNLTMFTYRYGI